MNFQKGIEMASDDQQRVNSRRKKAMKKEKNKKNKLKQSTEIEKKRRSTHDIDSQEPNETIIEMVKSF